MAKIEIKGDIIPDDYQGIYDWIGWQGTSAKKVNAALAEAKGLPVDIEINSGGGYITAGSEIYAALKNYTGGVNIRIIWAASAASVIAMAGHSVMEPTAMMFLHHVMSSAGGNYHQMEKEAEDLKNASKAMSMAYQLKAGITEEQAMKLMDKEEMLTAKRALELGLVDEIADGSSMAASYEAQMIPPAMIAKAQVEMAAYEAACERFEKMEGKK